MSTHVVFVLQAAEKWCPSAEYIGKDSVNNTGSLTIYKTINISWNSKNKGESAIAVVSWEC